MKNNKYSIMSFWLAISPLIIAPLIFILPETLGVWLSVIYIGFHVVIITALASLVTGILGIKSDKKIYSYIGIILTLFCAVYYYIFVYLDYALQSIR